MPTPAQESTVSHSIDAAFAPILADVTAAEAGRGKSRWGFLSKFKRDQKKSSFTREATGDEKDEYLVTQETKYLDLLNSYRQGSGFSIKDKVSRNADIKTHQDLKKRVREEAEQIARGAIKLRKPISVFDPGNKFSADEAQLIRDAYLKIARAATKKGKIEGTVIDGVDKDLPGDKKLLESYRAYFQEEDTKKSSEFRNNLINRAKGYVFGLGNTVLDSAKASAQGMADAISKQGLRDFFKNRVIEAAPGMVMGGAAKMALKAALIASGVETAALATSVTWGAGRGLYKEWKTISQENTPAPTERRAKLKLRVRQGSRLATAAVRGGAFAALGYYIGSEVFANIPIAEMVQKYGSEGINWFKEGVQHYLTSNPEAASGLLSTPTPTSTLESTATAVTSEGLVTDQPDLTSTPAPSPTGTPIPQPSPVETPAQAPSPSATLEPSPTTTVEPSPTPTATTQPIVTAPQRPFVPEHVDIKGIDVPKPPDIVDRADIQLNPNADYLSPVIDHIDGSQIDAGQPLGLAEQPGAPAADALQTDKLPPPSVETPGADQAVQKILNQQIVIDHPGDTFWESFNVPEGWINENGVTRGDVVKDMVVKFAQSNGHNLNLVHPGESLDLHDLLTEDQLDIVKKTMETDDTLDYWKNVRPLALKYFR